MSGTTDILIKKLADTINSSPAKKVSPYDTQAEVIRVDGDTAWVHIPGGVDETPVQLTANAKKGDIVQVRISGGQAWLYGNQTSPPTDDKKAIEADNKAEKVKVIAIDAKELADSANEFAGKAKQAADSAETSATEAKASAENASEYASRALGNLSTVQSVAETLTWITQHGTMALTTDTVLDPTHVYFIRDNDGDYEVGAYKYSIVTEPNVADIGTYYELSIDESLNNYVATHLAVDSEGLWIIPDVGGNKVLIATGNGLTYTTAGTYIIGKVNNTDVPLARFTSGEAIIGVADGTRAYMFLNHRSIQGIDKEGDTYFYVSDLRDDNGEYSAKDTFIGDGDTTVFYLSTSVFSNLVVKVNDVEQTINVDYTYDSSIWKITFISPPANGSNIDVTYISRNQNSKAYTFGNRATGSVIGGMSVAEGRLTTASGYASHAEGISTASSGSYSHAEGSGTTASGYVAHTEGRLTTASGYAAHAEGGTTIASGQTSHAEGGETIASGLGAHAEGNVTTASGQGAHAEGMRTVASKIDAHAEGTRTTASGSTSHAEGNQTTASGYSSHAEGGETTASGLSAHAEGGTTIASGQTSHAEGAETEASGLSAHAEGNVTTASGQGAHAEGTLSVASGSESHAQNWNTKASSFAQTVIGKCNIEDTNDAYALIIGNGTDTARSNALTVDWDGDITIKNHSSPIGTMKSHIPDSEVSCATGKYYQLAYLSLEPGIWIISYVGGFPNTNTTGIRDTFVTSATSGYNNVTTAPAAIGNITRDRRKGEANIIYCKASFPINVTSTTTYRVIGYQTSGQTNSVSGRMYAVRII